jgi:hypothetical protein
MLRKKEVIRKIDESETLCDLCLLEEKENVIGQLSASSCYMCSRHICREHMVFDDRDHGDYPTKYCTHCWEIGIDYRNKMEEIEDESDSKIEEQLDLWTEEALKEIEK